jgi:hypothetical protein
MISSLTLDATEDPRRAAASRANSVRFDESANNHYGSSRQSIDLPTRTGSGLGGHTLSERSLSHRSDGKPSVAVFGRNNSFGLEQSRLLGSIHNSPRVTANPPPGFFVLGPCPAIIRCWLTESFSNSSLLYAAMCTGATISSVSNQLLCNLGLDDGTFEDGGQHAIRLPVYLTEAKVHSSAAPRSGSPPPPIPTLMVKFVVDDHAADDRSIQIILGSDVLRSHGADILLSQDKVMIFDDERNQLSIPLCRPEDDSLYKDLCTAPRNRSRSTDPVLPPPASPVGIIGRPERVNTASSAASPSAGPTSSIASAAPSEPGDLRRSDGTAGPSTRSSLDFGPPKPADDSKSTTGSEKSFTIPVLKSSSGVWSNNWRPSSFAATSDANSKSVPSTYARPQAQRTMKVLRPTKTMANATRAGSVATPNGTDLGAARTSDISKTVEIADDAKSTTSSATSKANPIGSGSAFNWLNPGSQRRTTANG